MKNDLTPTFTTRFAKDTEKKREEGNENAQHPTPLFAALRLCVRLSLLAVAIACTGLEVGAQDIKLPPVTRVTLGNGIRLVLMEYHRAPLLNVVAQFRGGSADEPEDKKGVAGIVADLLRKGTPTRNANQIAEEIEFLGGDLSTGAGKDSVTVSLDVLAKDADAGLDLMTDCIRNSTFPEAEFNRTRDLEIAGLGALADNPAGIAAIVANQNVYGDSFYGLSPTITSVKKITPHDVGEFALLHLNNSGCTLIAVGDFKTDEMRAKLEKRFGDWSLRLPKMARSHVAPTAQTPGIILVDKPDATQTQVRWGRFAIPENSPDRPAAEVANTILGGGFTSRLIDEIRVNRSLTYGIGSSFAGLKSAGTFGVSTFTKIETTRELIDAVRDVLKKTADKGFTAQELAKVKGFMTGMFAQRLQTPDAIAGQLAQIELYGLPQDYFTTYLSKIRAVTLEDVNRVAKTYFDPANLTLTLVAPAAKVREKLNGLDKIGSLKVIPVGNVGK